MKRLRGYQIPSLWLAILSVLLCSAHIFAASALVPKTTMAPQSAAVLDNFNNMQLAFTKNIGQWSDSILFRANAGGTTMWFTRDGIYYQFVRRISRAGDSATGFDATADQMRLSGHVQERDSIENLFIKASFIGSNPNTELSGSEQLSYTCNYFLGNNQSKWRTDVPNYASVTFKDLYEGVDATFRGEHGRMVFELRAASATALSQVQTDYQGAQSVQKTGDVSVLQTNLGQKRFQGIMLESDFLTTTVASNKEEPSNVMLFYSTYLGGSSPDYGNGIAVDTAGNAYVTGPTYSSDFPTINPFDPSLSGGFGSDVFVTKLNPAGDGLIYSTYLGSGLSKSIAVDTLGNAYVTGSTGSLDFPMANPFRGSLNGLSDVFVTKLNPAGNNLVYSTYLGGAGSDYGNGIAVDTDGNAYVTGYTESPDFPTANSYEANFKGITDAFISKLSPAGNSLVYSTYLGGADRDMGYGIAVDTTRSAYITGYTGSSDFPMTNPFEGTLNGSTDAFVTKLNPAGDSLVYSTYLGGTGSDFSNGIALDASKNAYVTGITYSSDFPVVTPINGTYNGVIDAFIAKLSPAGNSLVYSTYLGGTSDNGGCGVAVDRGGNAYVTGSTRSPDFPTVNPFDPSFNGLIDVFVTKLNPAGNSMVYSTYLGGTGSDYVGNIALDPAGSAYVTGRTDSPDFPTSAPFDDSFNGVYDAFVSKLSTPLGGCLGTTGNVDCDTADRVDISDLTTLVDYLYISFTPLCNSREANVDGSADGRIDISDLTTLVDYLYISFKPPAPCQ